MSGRGARFWHLNQGLRFFAVASGSHQQPHAPDVGRGRAASGGPIQVFRLPRRPRQRRPPRPSTLLLLATESKLECWVGPLKSITPSKRLARRNSCCDTQGQRAVCLRERLGKCLGQAVQGVGRRAYTPPPTCGSRQPNGAWLRGRCTIGPAGFCVKGRNISGGLYLPRQKAALAAAPPPIREGPAFLPRLLPRSVSVACLFFTTQSGGDACRT